MKHTQIVLQVNVRISSFLGKWRILEVGHSDVAIHWRGGAKISQIFQVGRARIFYKILINKTEMA